MPSFGTILPRVSRAGPSTGCAPSRIYSVALIPVPEVARVLGVGHTATRNAIAWGALRVVRIGGRIVIPLTAIARLLGDERNLQFDGNVEIDHDLSSSIAAVAGDVESGRITPDPDGPNWIILAREPSKIRAR